MMNATETHKLFSRSRGAWLTLIFAMILVTGSMVQFFYRLTLPTDGWLVATADLSHLNWVYLQNLVGAPSQLQPGDELLAVDGQPVRFFPSIKILSAPANWQAGQTVPMVVKRDGHERTVDVPVVHWTAPAVWRRITSSADTATGLLSALILAFVGFFTYFRRPDLPSARALLILCAAIMSLTLSWLLPDGLSMSYDRPAYLLTFFFSYGIYGIVLAPSLLAFALHFPRTKQVLADHRWLSYGPAVIGLTLFIAVFSADNITNIVWLGTLGMIAASILSLVHSGFTQRDTVSRAQLRWAVGGFIIGLALFVLAYPSAFGWITSTFWATLLNMGPNLGFTIIGVTLAVAILRYRLFDIDLIIRRTLIYGVVTALLAFIYFGGVALFQSLFSTLTGERSSLAVVISTLAIAALFTPLRNRVQTFVDRRFFRQKYDAERTLEQFSETMRDEVDLDRMTVELAEAVEATMQPEHIALWVADSGQN